jgi:hypothetical protein
MLGSAEIVCHCLLIETELWLVLVEKRLKNIADPAHVFAVAPAARCPPGFTTSSAALVHPKIAVMAWYRCAMNAWLPAAAAATPIGRDGSCAADSLLIFSCIYRRWRWG